MDAGSRGRERNSSSPSKHGGVADDASSKPPTARMGSPSSGGSSGAARADSPASDSNKSNGKGSAPPQPAAEQQPPKKHAPPHGQSSDMEEARAPGREQPPGGDRRRGQRGPPEEGVEKNAAHFKMVADRFRALMERRERKLEEAMSDPQTRRDLEVMFPGVITGDYVTLLAGVRGMEEEDFQDLLDAARKRRREEELGAENGQEGCRKVPKTAGVPSPSSAPPRRSPNGSSSVAAPQPPPPPAGWEGGDGRRGRYYAQPPPPQQQQQQQQRPHTYADPYAYPRGATGGERRAGAAPVAALGGRGHGGGGGSRAAHARPAEDEVDDDGVFPHYSAPAGAGRRGGEHRGGGPSGHGGGGVGGGGPPPVWSRQQHSRHLPQQHQMHPAAARGGVQAVDGHVVPASRPLSDAAVAAAAAADRVEGRGPGGGEGRGGRGAGRSRAVAPADDYYDHPFYQREREPLGDGGMVRGGGGGRGGGGRPPPGRMHYNDTGPPMGAPPGTSAAAAAAAAAAVAAAAAAGGHRPYPGPPPHGARDRVERPSNGAQGSGSPRGHPMGPIERGEPLPPRYARPAQPGINQALYEAVERIFRHREKHGGGGGGGRTASPSVAPDGSKSEAIGTDDREVGVRGGPSPVTDAKKATMRIIGIMESFDGRLDDVMADPRARAELDAIFPGVKDREFRALLEGCIDRSQTPPLYRKPTDRDYRDGERVYSARMEYQQERERTYHREHPDDPRHPTQRHPPPGGYPGPEPPPMYRDARDRSGGSGGGRFYPAPRQAYPNPNSAYDPRDVYPGERPPPAAAAGAYEDQRLAARAARVGAGRGFIPAKHELPDDPDKAYDADPEATYPKYPGPGRMRQGSVDGGPPLMPRNDGRLQRSPALSPQQVRNGDRRGPGGPPPPHADPRGAAPPPLYKAPMRHGSAVGVSPSLEGGAYHHPHHPHYSHPHQARGAPGGSPSMHGRRGSDGASPPPQSLRRDVRPGVSAAGPPTGDGRSAAPVGTHARAGAITRGRGSVAQPSDGGVHMDEDDAGGGGGSASRSGVCKPKSEDDEEGGGGGGGGGRKTRASDPEGGGETPFCEVVLDASGVTRLFIPETPPIVPRRPPSKGNKRETLGDIAHRIPVTVMRPYFNYPLRTAAEAMNISVTTLKRLCRRHGVRRWPHRQISGINRAMAHLEFQQDQAGRRNSDKTNARNNQVSEQMQELLRRRKVMIEHAFESDDGGSRQPWKSSDSEDDGGGGGGSAGGGGDDADNLSDTNSNRRRSMKTAATATTDRRTGKKAPHPDDSTPVAPAYNPITADAAIRAVRGGRGRMLPRSPPSSSSAPDTKPQQPPLPDDDEPPARRGGSPGPPPMQSRRRLLPPTRPGRPSDHPPPPMRRQHHGAEMGEGERYEGDEAMEETQQHRHRGNGEQPHRNTHKERREREDEGVSGQLRLLPRNGERGRSSSRFGRREERRGDYRRGDMAEDEVDDDDEEIGEEEDDDEEYYEGEDEAAAAAGRTAAKREPRRAYRAGEYSSRRRSNYSPPPSPPQQQQQKRKQESPPDEEPGARRTPEGRRRSSSSSPSPSPAAAKRTKQEHEQQEQQGGPSSSPVSKPRSPLTCGPRRSPGGACSPGGARDGDASSSSKPPSAALPELPKFNLAGGGGRGGGGAKQEAWGSPTAPTPSTAQEA